MIGVMSNDWTKLLVDEHVSVQTAEEDVFIFFGFDDEKSCTISDAILDAISYTISRLRCRSFFLDVDVKTTTSAYDMEVAPKRPFLVTSISKF